MIPTAASVAWSPDRDHSSAPVSARRAVIRASDPWAAASTTSSDDVMFQTCPGTVTDHRSVTFVGSRGAAAGGASAPPRVTRERGDDGGDDRQRRPRRR